MILKQYYLGCLAHASYLLVDEGSRTALVVDPQRDVDQYVRDAQQLGATIRHVLLTHYHADFVAGHLELQKRTGARIGLGNAVKPEYPADLYADGERLEFQDLAIAVLHTPGHTPESVTYLVYDKRKDAKQPYAALTGDTLFIGDVGRPDLLASIGFTSEQLGAMLYHSLHQKLLKLPDSTLIYPAHGAGSMCGKNLSNEKVSTLGQQRASNYALQPMSEADFIALVSAGQPEAPQYFVHDAILNRQNRETLEDSLGKKLNPLGLEAALRLANSGATLLDVRDADEFAAGHLSGSLNIGLSGSFATWAGTMLPPKGPIVIVGRADQHAEAGMRLGRIGLDNLQGALAFDPSWAKTRPELVQRFERLEPRPFEAWIGSADRPQVLDIRTPAETNAGALPGATLIPLNQLPNRLAELDPKRPLAIVCRSGYRSSLAASLLQARGFQRLADLKGGMTAWDAAHSPAKG
jgi:glyoxylase-like metal-dependent hydrolase (beta-lactamase superfamily II)/rhodanese-related sulfurtransferase